MARPPDDCFFGVAIEDAKRKTFKAPRDNTGRTDSGSGGKNDFVPILYFENQTKTPETEVKSCPPQISQNPDIRENSFTYLQSAGLSAIRAETSILFYPSEQSSNAVTEL